MPTLLRIDSSPLSGERSFSRRLTGEFASQWQEQHPDGQVITRDLSATDLLPIDAEWIAAAYTPDSALTARQSEVLNLSTSLISELRETDEYVIGVPMHNFFVPSLLKLWIDQVVRVGKTFSYGSGVPAGVLQGKKVTFLIASGGVYDGGSPGAALNFIEPYLKTVFGLIGVADSVFIYAGGTSQARHGVEEKTILGPAIDSISTRLRPNLSSAA